MEANNQSELKGHVSIFFTLAPCDCVKFARMDNGKSVLDIEPDIRTGSKKTPC